MIYAYRCAACGTTVDIEASPHATPLVECPACRSPMHRDYSSINIIMGPGFRPKWADTPQKSKEAQQRFGREPRR